MMVGSARQEREDASAPRRLLLLYSALSARAGTINAQAFHRSCPSRQHTLPWSGFRFWGCMFRVYGVGYPPSLAASGQNHATHRENRPNCRLTTRCHQFNSTRHAPRDLSSALIWSQSAIHSVHRRCRPSIPHNSPRTADWRRSSRSRSSVRDLSAGRPASAPSRYTPCMPHSPSERCGWA